jgi:hypothetical protein
MLIKINPPLLGHLCHLSSDSEQMSFPSGGVVNFDDNISSNEGSNGSNVEEIIQWDRELCQSKTFSTALLILLGHAYNFPKLADQKKILLKFIDRPAREFFRRRSNQVMAFSSLSAKSVLAGEKLVATYSIFT